VFDLCCDFVHRLLAEALIVTRGRWRRRILDSFGRGNEVSGVATLRCVGSVFRSLRGDPPTLTTFLHGPACGLLSLEDSYCQSIFPTNTFLTRLLVEDVR
jgi:hypothetical protein